MALATTSLSSAYGMARMSGHAGGAADRAAQLSVSTSELFFSVCGRSESRAPADFKARSAALSVGRRSARSWDDSNRSRLQCRATYNVELIHNGHKHVLQVPDDETILSVALSEDLNISHDCKLGVCMTCPAKLESGEVDQSEGMLSDDVIERGYALMCVSYPTSDCTIRTIPEEELLRLQLATANDAWEVMELMSREL